MQSFEDMVDQADPEYKVKNYKSGGEQNRWATVIRTFLESSGILNNRGANTMSNIDAVENISKKPEEFLTLLQRIFPGTFTWGDQATMENTDDNFGALIQEMLPIKDEDRADLKRMMGRNIPENEIAALLGDPITFLELIQQNFPEHNIQLEGARWDKFRDLSKRGLDHAKMQGKFLGGVARDYGKHAKTIYKGAKKAYNKVSDFNKKVDRGIAKSKEFLQGGPTRRALTNTVKSLGNKITSTNWAAPATLGGQDMGPNTALTSAVGSIINARPGAGTGGSKTECRPGQVWDPASGHCVKEDPKAKEEEPAPVDNFYDKWKEPGTNKNSAGLEAHLRTLTDDESLIDELMDMRSAGAKNNPATQISSATILAIRNRLKQENLSEQNFKMKTFDQMIKDAGNTLLEAPEDELPPEGEMPAEEPAAPPVEVEELPPDDTDKLQVDMLEQVRRALVVNPNDIDRETYMKLTTRVTFENVGELKPLLNKVIENNYPDLEMGDVEPGPGV